MKKSLFMKAASLLAVAVLAGCGGSSNDGSSIIAVRVMGDSLADVGTFGRRFTIQGAENLVYPELVANALGVKPACNYFSFTGTTFLPATDTNCINHAVGGGVINGASSALTAADPRNLSVQFAQGTSFGAYSGRELFVIDGGGNDAAALVGAYLGAASDGGKAYVALLGTQLTATQVGTAAAGGAAGLAAAGGQYMTALADTFSTMVKTKVLDNGGQRVVLINVPAITLTPRFQAVLAGVAAASGGGATGAAVRAQSEAAFKGWIDAFNTRLASNFSGNDKVIIVDLNKSLSDWVASPSQYGFTNVKDAACPVSGLGADGLPTYNFATCTEEALAAKPPTGATGGSTWYKTWLFSDGFHPSPVAHKMSADIIVAAIKAKGWK